jgi:SAM-dependent methyltransferase
VSLADDFKERQRATWSSGDWPAIAPTIQDAADAVVERVGVTAGQDFLDVATGNGNAAVQVALRGARVTGLDLVPELIEMARARAREAGVEVEWIVGDAEELPFPDASFDRVVSSFGTMFAPRHQRAADELVRVARPGAVIGVTAWTPEGLNGELFKTLGAHLPSPPELEPPVRWGDEAYVRDLFSGPGLEVSCERRAISVSRESVEAWVAHGEQALGPMVMAKAALEPQGRWEAARSDLVDLYERYNRATDGTLEAPAEYLLTVVIVSG